MDLKKQKEIIQGEIEKAQQAGDTELINELQNDLTVIDANIAEEERYAELAESKAYKSIRLREVLSDYFMKRKDMIKGEFIARLKETYLRKPVTADQYGSYKEGLFTYGCYIVETVYDKESHLWQLSIFPETGGAECPHNVVKDIRYKYIPDHCMMWEACGPREQKGSAVHLYEMPVESDEEQKDEQKKPGIFRRLFHRNRKAVNDEGKESC